ncbi:UDP-N-acetylmuramoyl-L-alanyl-D-glutamate--2,6-diaminopimelate ligase MurE homolog, chloroplastic [Silene latifolia]|uniref:UDP-N-acetylmuramoyl-L-alanyl-D-glutamate--2, 6-diaminopimelate ligase MurE homolog, chloroplastic n=1 Tax=Silene latifolia TaxID=37657 RepID=UPI003D778EA6
MSLQLFLTLPSLSLSSSLNFPKYPFRRPRLSLSVSTNNFPNPSDDDPPEAPEDTAHGVSKFQQIKRQAARARKLEEDDFAANQSVYLDAIRDVEDAPDDDAQDDDARGYATSDGLFADIDKAISLKRKEFVKKGLLQPNPPKTQQNLDVVIDAVDELDADEVVDLEEIDELRGLKIVDEDEEEEEEDGELGNKLDAFDLNNDASFDYVNDFDSFGNSKVRIIEPKFRMTLAELLDECKVVPISVYGDLEVEITGIEHDSRLVNAGDLFVCCVGSKTDGHLFLSEADKRGAVAVVASKEIDLGETLGCKGLVLVEDTNAALPALAAAFYRWPTRDMSVIGVTGTHGKTTTGYLIKGMYEAMGLRTGLMSSVAYYLHGDNKLDSPESSPDGVLVQKLMAKMLHNGAEAVVMEASSNELARGRCEEVDFDIAVFTNSTRDHSGFEGSEEEYRVAQGKLFSRMVDPDRHRKIVNIDDVNAPFFINQGNPDVPVLTFALDNKNADVHPLKYELSLFETTILVNTPQGILEISSGLLGKHNIYNILAAVAVGIAVGAPLEDIVRGIEEVDAVPGRCELIDEEQAFGVIVDHARTPNGLSRLLDSVRELNPRRIITVIGSSGEQERGKRPLLTKIATDKSDVTMLTSDNPRNEDPLDILDDMLSGIGWTMQDYLKHGENDYYPPLSNGHRLFLHDIRRVAVRCAVAMGEEGDMVVVAGKGHEAYQIEGDKKEFFDDREECREALQYVDELHQAGIDTSEFPWRLPESH